ncbi:ABC-ATPase domain-containing protein [Metallumcola ferriviriculae]|uniref:ABC-ATPase domain-containing protein n=1 Tax=Metallumcola ferriviriculae TaxID=3039180 RepID=A0AAU0UPX7_9FIRM|nr:ABC-ATPase domain-containing protein [Desulfitibacteraceae bacterium MK1]
MLTLQQLREKLFNIDGKGYKAYKNIAGQYQGENFKLYIDYVQGDPFASPSRVRLCVAQQTALFPVDSYSTRIRNTALTDFLNRQAVKAIEKSAKGSRGTGKSGMIAVDKPGQQILSRTAVAINNDFVELRASIGLPARGRRVLGKQAAAMFLDELPQIIDNCLLYNSLPQHSLWEHIYSVEDQEHLRASLADKGLVAFVGNGSILPRKSGVSDRPLSIDKAVSFKSPALLEITLELPHAGKVTGMGFTNGVTLITGGGYHGKSTLLQAIQKGIYNHIPGDGREKVVSLPSAVKIRAEDGRRVERVDISPFINNLPYGLNTKNFSSEDASGSTSQAANIMEALEIQSELLLLDEDTSATNFMIRDVRMQQLVTKNKEPITPFIDKVRLLVNQLEVSTVLVVGGSGDYLDVADTVIMMDEYYPLDVTRTAKDIAARIKTGRNDEGGTVFGSIPSRIVDAKSINPQKGKKRKISARGVTSLQFGVYTIDLSQVEQLVDISQTQAIGDIIVYMSKNYLNGTTLAKALERVYQDIERYGLDIISPFYGQHPGDYALPRLYEVAAAINRLRSLRIRGGTL